MGLTKAEARSNTVLKDTNFRSAPCSGSVAFQPLLDHRQVPWGNKGPGDWQTPTRSLDKAADQRMLTRSQLAEPKVTSSDSC